MQKSGKRRGPARRSGLRTNPRDVAARRLPAVLGTAFDARLPGTNACQRSARHRPDANDERPTAAMGVPLCPRTPCARRNAHGLGNAAAKTRVIAWLS